MCKAGGADERDKRGQTQGSVSFCDKQEEYLFAEGGAVQWVVLRPLFVNWCSFSVPSEWMDNTQIKENEKNDFIRIDCLYWL